MVELTGEDCGFAYRHSRFKGERHRWAVLEVRFRLRRGQPAMPRYGELSRRMKALGETPGLADCRRLVLALRREKGMLYDADEPDSCGAGSFFVNPVVSRERAGSVEQMYRLAAGAGAPAMPRYDDAPGRVKLAAGWLVEQAGFPRGHRRGRAGLSTRHALAITNRGGASASEIIALARQIRGAVQHRFSVTLRPEPVLVGFVGDPLG